MKNIKKTENLLVLALILFIGALILHLLGCRTAAEVVLVMATLPIPMFLFIEAYKQKQHRWFLCIVGIILLLVIAYGIYCGIIDHQQRLQIMQMLQKPRV